MIDVKKYKVFIFDFDETMYYSPTIKQSYINYMRKVVGDLTNFSKDEIEFKLEQYGFKSDGETRISFGKNCEKFGVTKQQWNDYRIENFFEIDYDSAIVADNNIYKKLAKIGNLYIVSNELKENIEYKAKKMGIDLTSFKEICAPNKSNILDYKSSKKEVYEKILQNENCSPLDAIVVGDRYAVDILPFEELGGKGVLVKKASEINDLFKF